MASRVNRWVMIIALVLFQPGLSMRPARASQSDGNGLRAKIPPQFAKLTQAEEKLVLGCERGGLVNFGPIPERIGRDGCSSAQCDDSRMVRAQFIEWLCTDSVAVPLVNHRGISISGACLDCEHGGLDLQNANVPFPLKIKNSLIPKTMVLRGLRIRALTLNGSCCEGLNANSLEVDGDLQLAEGFEAHGVVELSDARIHGELVMDGSRFFGDEKGAIIGQNLFVGSNAYLRDGFSASGTVDFTHATIEGFFQCRQIQRNPKMTLKLRSTRVATLLDDESCWPDADKLHLDGFVYDRLDEESGIDVKKRLEWLKLQPKDTFHPQPYDNLAKALRAGGYDEEAIEVLVEKERDRASRFERYSDRWMFYNAFAKLTDYGYRPLRACKLALGFIFLGTVLFHVGFRLRVVVPAQDDARKSDGSARGPLVERYPQFNPLIFSADSFTPLIDLKQDDYWTPTITFPENAGFGLRRKTFAVLLRWYLWIHILAGWILSTLIAIGVSNLVRQ